MQTFHNPIKIGQLDLAVLDKFDELFIFEGKMIHGRKNNKESYVRKEINR